MENPRIYVASLSDYNNGRLEGKWFDLSDYSNGSELMDAINEMLEEITEKYNDGEVREEWAVHDYEYIPSSLASEYMGENEFQQIYDIMEASEENNIPFEVLIERVGDVGSDDYGNIAESLVMVVDGNDETDIVFDLEQQIGALDFSFWQNHIYIDDVTERVMYGEDVDRFREDIEYENTDMSEDEIETLAEERADEEESRRNDDLIGYLEDNGYSDIPSFVSKDYESAWNDLSMDYDVINYEDKMYVFSNNYGFGGGLLVGSLVGAYLGYKVGKYKKKVISSGFETEKRIGKGIKNKVQGKKTFDEGGMIGFTNDPVYSKGNISVQRIGGSSMWRVAINKKSVGRVYDAFTKEQAFSKAQKEKFVDGGGVGDNYEIVEDKITEKYDLIVDGETIATDFLTYTEAKNYLESNTNKRKIRDNSKYLRDNTKFNNGGVVFTDYNGSSIMYEPNYDEYFVNDEVFYSMEEAKNYIDNGSGKLKRDAFNVLSELYNLRDKGFTQVQLDGFNESIGYVIALRLKDTEIEKVGNNAYITLYKKGGNVNTGLSWHLDRAKFNKSEDYEIPLNKRKFNEGGGVDADFKDYVIYTYLTKNDVVNGNYEVVKEDADFEQTEKEIIRLYQQRRERGYIFAFTIYEKGTRNKIYESESYQKTLDEYEDERYYDDDFQFNNGGEVLTPLDMVSDNERKGLLVVSSRDGSKGIIVKESSKNSYNESDYTKSYIIQTNEGEKEIMARYLKVIDNFDNGGRVNKFNEGGAIDGLSDLIYG